MHKSKKVIKDKSTVVYDVRPQEEIDPSLKGRGLMAEAFALDDSSSPVNVWMPQMRDTAKIDSLPKVKDIFGGEEHALNVANAVDMHQVEGIYWILPPVLGISYLEVKGGYSVCLRVLVADAVCCKLTESSLSAHLPLDMVLVKADMEIGLDLKKKEIFWHGKACYRGFDTAWKWRCADGRGVIIRL